MGSQRRRAEYLHDLDDVASLVLVGSPVQPVPRVEHVVQVGSLLKQENPTKLLVLPLPELQSQNIQGGTQDVPGMGSTEQNGYFSQLRLRLPWESRELMVTSGSLGTAGPLAPCAAPC